MPKLPLLLLKARRVVRQQVMSRLPPLRLRRERFLRNLPLLSPKLSADSSPPDHLRTPPRSAQNRSPFPRHCSLCPQRGQRLLSPFLHLHRQRQRLSVTARHRISHPRVNIHPLLRSPYHETEHSLPCRQLPLGSLQARSERNTTFDSLHPS